MSQPSPSVSLAWTPDAVTLLRRCVGDGVTSLETARRLSQTFGAALTKSAVIGKASRLGLRFGRGAGGDAQQRGPALVRVPVGSLEGRHAQVHVPGRGWTVAERVDGCRWPLGEAPPGEAWRQRFCCQPAAPGQTWCPAHRAVGRIPTTESQRQAIEALADWAGKRA